jgi:hypothetical protein
MSGLITTLVGLALALVLLSLLVQGVQELWKHLSDSRAVTFTRCLEGMFGPLVGELLRPGALPDVVRPGPFRLRRAGPWAVVPPLDRAALIGALRRTAPGWVQRASERLDLEVEIQDGEPAAASPAWAAFVEELRGFVRPAARSRRQREAAQQAPEYEIAQDILELLESWKAVAGGATAGGSRARTTRATPSRSFDAWIVRAAFRDRFLAPLQDVERDYPQLLRNCEHACRRRNLRGAFTISILLALVFNLPFHRLWNEASRPSTAARLEAVALAMSAEQAGAASGMIRDLTAELREERREGFR